ncbi:hypothetical protein BCR33DRAFT_730283, partial [Rhizoclosmatium globosum]
MRRTRRLQRRPMRVRDCLRAHSLTGWRFDFAASAVYTIKSIVTLNDTSLELPTKPILTEHLF